MLGGEVLEDQAEVAVTDASLRATFALIENAAWAPSRRPSAPPARAGGLFPAPLRSYVGGDVDAVRWKRIGGGVSQAILPTASDASVRLLRIPGGSRVPDHGHRGLELTLVLQGAFYDDRARFGPGDVEVADAEFEHQPVAEEAPIASAWPPRTRRCGSGRFCPGCYRVLSAFSLRPRRRAAQLHGAISYSSVSSAEWLPPKISAKSRSAARVTPVPDMNGPAVSSRTTFGTGWLSARRGAGSNKANTARRRAFTGAVLSGMAAPDLPLGAAMARPVRSSPPGCRPLQDRTVP